jgi:monofunctional biosynthetic peptidoglycan transglycosylase
MTKRPKSTIPKYKRRRKGSLIGRVVGWIVKLIVAFLVISVLWVLAYRFVNPPITITMIGDIVAGRGAAKDWMPIGQIDRDMVRGASAAVDG